MEHAPNTSWTNSFNIPYWIIIQDQWVMLLQLLGSIPSQFLINFRGNQWELLMNLPETIPSSSITYPSSKYLGMLLELSGPILVHD